MLEFITNRPPIARVEMILSGYYHLARPYPPRPPTNAIHVAGSIQPRGFYVHLDPQPNMRMPEWRGASSNLFWQLTPISLATAPREGPGASASNRTARIAGWGLSRLEEHLQFGLDWIREVEFVDAIHFHGWRKQPGFRIEGELIVGADGVPVGSRYAGRQGQEVFRVDAVFRDWALFDGGRRWLPRQVVYRRYERFSTPPRGPFGTRCTNRLVLLETGLLPDQGAGFQPGLFMAATDPPRHVAADSNGVMYIVTEAGLMPYAEGEIDIRSPLIGGPEKELWLERRRQLYRLFLGVLVATAGIGAGIALPAVRKRCPRASAPISRMDSTDKPSSSETP